MKNDDNALEHAARRPGRTTFAASLGWHFGQVIAGIVEALARLAIIAGVIALAVYLAGRL